jgi:hypothetical protein
LELEKGGKVGGGSFPLAPTRKAVLRYPLS